MPDERYRRFVDRIWDRLEQRTGRAPTYIDANHIASYCPACLDGTILIVFVERPVPRAMPSSRGGGVGACSHGCTAREIAEAL